MYLATVCPPACTDSRSRFYSLFRYLRGPWVSHYSYPLVHPFSWSSYVALRRSLTLRAADPIYSFSVCFSCVIALFTFCFVRVVASVFLFSFFQFVRCPFVSLSARSLTAIITTALQNVACCGLRDLRFC